MAKSFIPSDLISYRYPDAEYTPSLTDKNFLLSSQSRSFIMKNKSSDVVNITIPGAQINNLFVVGNNERAMLTTI